jgi:hypothetical protein
MRRAPLGAKHEGLQGRHLRGLPRLIDEHGVEGGPRRRPLEHDALREGKKDRKKEMVRVGGWVGGGGGA